MFNADEYLEPIFSSIVENNEEGNLMKNNKSIIKCMDKIYNSLRNERDIEEYLKRTDYNNLFLKMKRWLDLNKIQSIIFSYLDIKYDRERTDIDDLSNYLNCNRLLFLTFMNDIEILEKKKLVIIDRKENDINFKIPVYIIEYLSKYDKLPDLSSDIENINYFTKNEASENKNKNIRGGGKNISNLISYTSINTKNMYYNKDEEEAINDLKTFLQNENFIGIIERLKSKNMRTGFACLFSGEPGTGKTETALQLAKETKRDIMKVDIPSIRSKSFGKAEKNVKRIFDEYNEFLEKTEIAPILFINEADSIFVKRGELSKRNRSIIQCENTMTNIMLEEMELFKGIMIATTNLTLNMDTAFERRFLYKIDFKKPGLNVRKCILKLFIPEVTDEMAQEISTKFDLTGGQIENISRKLEIDYIMKNENITMDKLKKYCKDEKYNCFIEKTIRIGFNNNI